MRFVCDNTLGKLRRWLALLGYDVTYDARPARALVFDGDVHDQERLVLGRCPSLVLEPGFEDRFFHVESETLADQLRTIAEAFPQDFTATFLTRCSHCNVALHGPVPLAEVEDRVPPKVRRWREEFLVCPECDRLYWEGTHTERIRAFLRDEVGLAL